MKHNSTISNLSNLSVLSRLILVIICISISGFSTTLSFKQQQESSVIKLETTLVQVPVIVSDVGGRYITDLQRGDFKIFENEKEQGIQLFRTIDEPFNVALLIDSSGSTLDQLSQIKSAAIAFVDNLRNHDHVMVVNFNDSVKVMCGLTNDRGTLHGAIINIEGGEYTQVYEAIYTTIWEKLRHSQGRKAAILFSDGIDTASSEISEEDTLNAVAATAGEGIIVYTIRYNTRPDVERKLYAQERLLANDLSGTSWRERRRKLDRVYRKADEYIQELAEISGGVVKQADTLVDLEASFAEIAEELRHQYLLGYYSANKDIAGKQRRVVVRVSRSNSEVKVRAKSWF